MARQRIAPPAMDNREMPFWEGSYGCFDRGVHGCVAGAARFKLA
jgi:hypothetical protein